MIKVSVVVPTYRPGDGLNRLVDSLDAQTLPADEFEVVFVDDGSPDDTFARLQELARTRPNVRAEQIENSGWPCRPRNVGTDLAVGEYVAYMDHDDELGPDALRAAWEYAHANHADVLTGKEARTHNAGWAIDTYREDIPQSVGREDRNPLVPMNPHKLYRRAFLQEHGIRFIEDGRVMWEDIFFNVTVQAHAKVISTLSSTPYYHWFATKGSGSTAFRRENPDYWKWMRRVIASTDEELGTVQPLAHRQLMGHHYRSRVVASFDTKFAKRPAGERDTIFAECRALQRDFELTRFDAALNASGRLRAHLLHEGRQDLLMVLPDADAGVPGWGTAVGMRWDDDGVLHLEADAEWSTAAGRRIALARDGERVVKVLPPEVAAAVPAELSDVTDEVAQATLEIGMRERTSRFVWMLPSEWQVSAVDAPDGSLDVRGHVSARLDTRTAVDGRPLSASRWDLNLRAVMGGSVSQQTLRSATGSTIALHDGGVLLAYVNDDERVTVLTEKATGEALHRLTPVSARIDQGDLLIALAGTHAGSGAVAARIPVPKGTPIEAALEVANGEAVLRLPSTTGQLLLQVGDRVGERPVHWVVDARDGNAVSLTPVLPAPAPKPQGPSLKARVRRAGGRVLRRLGLRH